MKKLLIITFCVCTFSCSKDIDSLNTDVKHTTTAPGQTFFANATKNLFDILNCPAWSAGIPAPLLTSMRLGPVWSQQITLVTYTDLAKFYYTANWSELYDVLNDLKSAYSIISGTEPLTDAEKISQKNMLAILEMMKAQVYMILVDSFGNIPYSQALDVDNVTPKYDDAKTIYIDLISRLTAAINDLNLSAGSFGSADLIYQGNVSLWKKFGNSLKLKMGLRVFDADNVMGSKAVQEAVSGGVMSSNSDNAILKYLSSPPNTNPLWLNVTQGNRKDVVIAEPYVDSMNVRNDPRRSIVLTEVNGQYKGGQYGEVINYDDYSNFGGPFRTPTMPGILLDYSSVEFFLAEAAEREIVGNSSDAELHYNKGIKASFDFYGASNFDDYIIQPNVNYSTANGSWKEKIGVQKWIALINQGVEAWAEYRRLDYPILFASPGSYVNTVPVRQLYPASEQTLNKVNYDEASQAIGKDLLTTKLFWDKL